jgi:predicted methyltransferase
MLKPGGTLGIVDHRLPERADTAREKSSGYLKTSTVRRLAEAAGFRFVAGLEVNANPEGLGPTGRGRLDAAADLSAQGPGPRQICGDRRIRTA